MVTREGFAILCRFRVQALFQGWRRFNLSLGKRYLHLGWSSQNLPVMLLFFVIVGVVVAGCLSSLRTKVMAKPLQHQVEHAAMACKGIVSERETAMNHDVGDVVCGEATPAAKSSAPAAASAASVSTPPMPGGAAASSSAPAKTAPAKTAPATTPATTPTTKAKVSGKKHKANTLGYESEDSWDRDMKKLSKTKGQAKRKK